MKTYEVTIERTEVTIVTVQANTQEEAELLAWHSWETEKFNYGLGATNITEVKEITE